MKAMKALEFVFKFIIQSRVLKRQLENTLSGGQPDQDFRRDVGETLQALNSIMGMRDEILMPTQALALENFSSIFHEPNSIYTDMEMGLIAQDFLKNVVISPLHKHMFEKRFKFVQGIVGGCLFSTCSGRMAILPTIVAILRDHIVRCDDLARCWDLLGDILKRLSHAARLGELDTLESDGYSDVSLLIEHLLQPIVELKVPERMPDHVRGSQLSCVLNMLRLVREEHYSRFIRSLSRQSAHSLALFLHSMFTFMDDLITNNQFPSDWLVMRMLQNEIILSTIQSLSSTLSEKFLVEPAFQFPLWDAFFNLSISYICQSDLQIEQFSDSRRDKILAKPDKRNLMAFQIETMWNELGERQTAFIPSLVGRIQEMALVKEIQVRKLALPIFYKMMEREVATTGQFQQVETELIDSLDRYVNAGRGDREYVRQMDAMLSKLFQASRNKVLQVGGPQLIAKMTQLLTHLLSLRNVKAGDEFREERASCLNNLLNFYMSIG
jgi:dedicator of cytokinesis protein 3